MAKIIIREGTPTFKAIGKILANAGMYDRPFKHIRFANTTAEYDNMSDCQWDSYVNACCANSLPEDRDAHDTEPAPCGNVWFQCDECGMAPACQPWSYYAEGGC